MEKADEAPHDVPLPSKGVQKRAQGTVSGDAARHRVDREVPAAEIVGDGRPGRHDGQGGRPRIALRSGGRHVDPETARRLERRGAEAPVGGAEPPPRLDGQPLREFQHALGWALGGQVEVIQGSSKKKIADRAPDQIRGEPGGFGEAAGRRENLG